jgi:hypothetical protein
METPPEPQPDNHTPAAPRVIVRAVEGAFTPGGFGPAHGGMEPGGVEGLRPLRVGEVLDAAIKLYRRNAVDLWKIVACVVVPVLLIRTIIVGVTLPSGSFVSNGLLYTENGRISVPVGAGIAGAVLSVIAALIASGALAITLVDAYVGQPLDWVAAIREAGGRLGSLLWLAILWAVLVFVGLIAFLLPGIWLIVVWSVSVPALMFEHVGGLKALGRSFDLVRGRWWATFAEMLVAIIMVAIVTFVIGFVITEITKGLKIDSIGLWLAFSWLSSVLSGLITFPFISAVIAVIYIDLRVRKEALDIELLASASRASTGAVTPFGTPTPSGLPDAPASTSPPSLPTE